MRPTTQLVGSSQCPMRWAEAVLGMSTAVADVCRGPNEHQLQLYDSIHTLWRRPPH
jgi:hypothetical protein